VVPRSSVSIAREFGAGAAAGALEALFDAAGGVADALGDAGAG
jgi:hypothetical protein